MKKLVLAASIISAFTVRSFATGQIPDLLIIGKDTFSLFANPLESYFQVGHSREFPELKGCGSTACWRGYQAVWMIINKKLYLLKVQSCHTGNWCTDTHPANLQLMFGDKFSDGKVFASWVTDSLVVPFGKLLRYIHMGYGSTYEFEKLISVKDGNIEFTKEFHNIVPNPKRLSRYDDSVVHETIFDLVDKTIRWNKLEKDEDDWWFEDVDIIITKDGKTKVDKESVTIDEYYPELRRILNKVKWQIVKRFGLPYEERLRFTFYFDYKHRRVLDTNDTLD